jgi:HD-like signal output (HDOD) protein
MATSSVLTEVLLQDLAQQLPAAPRLLAELGRLVRAPETDARDVVALLKRDASLVSRLLRMANSAAYARAEPIGAIEDAVVAVGFGEVHRLVGALASVQLADTPLPLHGVSSARYRENSLFVGTLMEEFAGRTQLDPHACYTIGLLRGFGMLILERAAQREDLHVTPFRGSGAESVTQWQHQFWGTDCWQVAAAILEHWHLPPDIVLAIEHHDTVATRSEPVVHLLALASGVAAQHGYGLPSDHVGADAASIGAAGLTSEQFRGSVERAERTFMRLRSSVV